MIRAWSVADVRAAESVRLAQVPDGALMQRAAAGLAGVCAGELRAREVPGRRRGARSGARVTGSRVVLLVGAGNNGGDALWAGALLARRGARVDAVLLSGACHPQGLAALRAAGGRLLECAGADGDAEVGAAGALLAAADLVVDGIVGLGGAPGLRQPAASVVAAIPAGVTVVAVDLPSGVDPDSGATPAAHVRADVTVTFGAAKACLVLPPASHAVGRVVEVDIGLGQLLPPTAAVERLETADAAALWPVPGPADDKYRRGVLGVVAGSPTYTGAAVLAVGGALRAGLGMVRYVGPEHAADQVRVRWPEVVFGAGRVQAWLVGSGVDPQAHDGQVDAVRAALASDLPVVVDAGALGLLPDRREAPTLLTPHAGELARLLTDRDPGTAYERGDVERRPVEHVLLAARVTGATVLLKGATTLVATPDGRLRSQADAPSWLATAGAGDVLAGVAGALLAGGLDPLDAGALAALAHGRAATLASSGGPIVAHDVASALPSTIGHLLRSR